MKRLVYPAGVLLVGMAAAHLLFTLLIYRSDLALHAAASALKEAGYLVVPNAHVLPQLTRLAPAFCGALFFTLTTGAGLSLLAFFAAWLYKRLFRQTRKFLFFMVAAWLAVVAAANLQGFNLEATSAALTIPPLVFFLTVKWRPAPVGRGDRWTWAIHLVVIAAVALAWVPRLDRNVFINIRDYLLMTQPAGQAVNAFYYRYTLYPAELFKSPAQKLMIPVCIKGADDFKARRQIAGPLLKNDYLPIADADACRLHIQKQNDVLQFADSRGPVMDVGLDQFLAQPDKTLKTVSRKSDTAGIFRQFTFLSLLGALPLSLYVFVHALFGSLLFFIRRVPVQSALASLICMGIGLGAVWPLYGIAPSDLSRAEIARYLDAGHWPRQRDALKAIADQGIDPLRFDVDKALIGSPHVPVRYWLAQALSNSKQPAAYRMLLTFLKDPQPNVACMAYYGLGQSSRQPAASVILTRIPEIRHWYVQWYAYKALKNLGWTQSRSGTTSGRPS